MRLFAYAFTAAFIQVFLTEHLAVAVNRHKRVRALAFLVLKLLIYAVGIGKTFANYIWYIDRVIYGFIAGAGMAVFVLLVYKMVPKEMYKAAYKWICDKTKKAIHGIKNAIENFKTKKPER